MTWDDLIQYRHAKRVLKPNYILIPVTSFEMNEEGAERFNEIYQFLLTQHLRSIVRTPSGGISFAGCNFVGHRWDIITAKSYVEITVCANSMWRFQFRMRHEESDGTKLYGAQAFGEFKRRCQEEGVDLDAYRISKEQGYIVKSSIPAPLIDISEECKTYTTYENCHHIDFHNSYPAGLCNTHPEFKPIVEYFYNRRHDERISEYERKKAKAVLNFSIGNMQNNKAPYWAHLAKDAICDNLARVRELAERLKANGYIVLAYNTDGIWYRAWRFFDKSCNTPYCGDGQGVGLGQWSNDHTYCKLRFKSKGCYEFIENGKYKAVVRGQTTLDRVKPREEWQWGDIFKKELRVIKYYFVPGYGMMSDEVTI